MGSLGYEFAQYSPMQNNGTYVDAERQLRAAASAGFDWYAIDTWTIQGYQAAGGDLAAFVGLAAELGMDCGQLQTLVVGAPGLSDALVDALVAAAPVVEPATVQVIVVSDAETALHPIRSAAQRIRAVAPDVTFAMEAVPFAPLASLNAARDFISATGIDGFGINVDSWHFSQGPDDWDVLESLTKDDIVHLQFNDRGPNISDDLRVEIMRQKLPGEGDVDLVRFLDIVRRAGYDGRGGVEVLSKEMQALPPEEVAVAEYTAGSRFWG